MTLIQAIVLGIVQGLTEFLPVSSSGHLILFQHLFGLNEPELIFDICLHLGTLFAICIVFFKDIQSIIISIWQFIPQLIQKKASFETINQNPDLKISMLIVLGSIPTAFIGLIFHKLADQIFSSLFIVGFLLLITGTVLLLTRKVKLKGVGILKVTITQALIIGVVQGFAVLPGISRSGSTIAASLFLGVDRKVAGRFSFLLSIPAIFGALILTLKDLGEATHINIIPTTIGTLISFIIGFFALKVLLRVVNQGNLYLFSPYCYAIGSIALVYKLIF